MALLAEYGFNEGSGATAADSSGNGYNAAVYGSWGTGHTSSGLVGTSAGDIDSTGNGSANVPAGSPGFVGWAGITVMGWINTNASSTSWILYSNLDYYGIALGCRAGNVIAIRVRTNLTAGEFPTGIGVSVNAWQHLAMSWADGVATVYLNGISVWSQSVPGGTIGGRQNGPTKLAWASGAGSLFDDIRIFDTALSATDIATWMGTPVGGGGGSARVTVARSSLWSVRARASGSPAATGWAVRARTGDAQTIAWATLGRTAANIPAAWAVRVRVGDTQLAAWTVLGRIVDGAATSWTTRARIAGQQPVAWLVDAIGITRVAASRAAAWNVRARTVDTQPSAWTVCVRTGDSATTGWNVRARIVDPAASAWTVRQLVTDTQPVGWNVEQIGRVLAAILVGWTVRQRNTETAETAWAMRRRLADQQATAWAARQRSTDQHATTWTVRARAGDQCAIAWQVFFDTSNYRDITIHVGGVTRSAVTPGDPVRHTITPGSPL